MKWISPLLSDARKKIGGSVFARNQFGNYVRNKTIPANPQTPSQQANRALFATASAAWKALDDATRLAWGVYAETVTRRDSLGQRYRPSGYGAFVTCFRGRQFLGFTTAGATPANPLIQLPPTGMSLEIHAGTGGSEFVIVNHTAAQVPYFGGLVMRSTPPLGAGINFVASADFRNLPFGFSRGSGYLDFSATWDQVFGGVAIGQKVWVELLCIDYLSGAAGQPVRLMTTAIR